MAKRRDERREERRERKPAREETLKKKAGGDGACAPLKAGGLASHLPPGTIGSIESQDNYGKTK